MIRKTKQKTLKNVALAALISGSAAPLTGQAAVFVESTDFSNSSASPTVLLSGVTDVSGGVGTVADTFDFFLVSGFQGGAAYSLSFSYPTLLAGSSTLNFYVDGGLIGSAPASGLSFLYSYSGTMPLNGQLNVGINGLTEGGASPQNYNFNLTAPLAPAVSEPETLSLLALGLAGLAGTRKRLNRHRA